MKVTLLLLALLGSTAFSVQARSSRRLHQADAPAGGVTVFDVAEENGLTLLVDAAQLDSLDSSLDNETLAYTVFAPTNEAFEALLAETGFSDLQDFLENSYGSLDPTLQYHFLTTPYTLEQLVEAGSVPSNFEDQPLSFSADGTIIGASNNATIITPNVQAGQTIIHVIDTVLIPPYEGGPAPGSAPTPGAASV